VANLAVLASGRGSNFTAVAGRLRQAGRHTLAVLITDSPGAPVLERARELGIPAFLVPYAGRSRPEAEAEMLGIIAEKGADVVALAGFMRLLTPRFLGGFPGDIVNLHPSLLPRHPGAHGIEESWRSADHELGITVMRVDEGCDTGPVIAQWGFRRDGNESLEEVEERIHALEHALFPAVLLDLLDAVEGRKARA
jgi:phosphoribosylglycinamide formyltransferase 1